MSVAAIPYTVSVPFGIFELDGRNIRGIKEKPAYNYFANAGIYLIKKSILNLIPSNKFFNATDFIEKLINLNKSVIRYPITGFWIDIGSKDEYEKAIEMQKHL
jgi:NDP-sugar pyrophosphorylase family protein